MALLDTLLDTRINPRPFYNDVGKLTEFAYYTAIDLPLQCEKTSVHIWDIERPEEWALFTDDEEARARIEQGRNLDSHPDRSDPGVTIISAVGDATSPHHPMSVSNEFLDTILSRIGTKDELRAFLRSRHPHVSSEVVHTEDGSQPEALVICIRFIRASRCLIGVIRIDLETLNTTAFLSFRSVEASQRFHCACAKAAALLRSHPLYLLTLVFENQFFVWSEWFICLWDSLIEAETDTGMTSVEWAAPRGLSSKNDLRDTDKVLRVLHKLHTELCHFETVMRVAKKFAKCGRETIATCENLRARLGREILSEGHRADLERRFRRVAQNCEAMDDRSQELLQRLKGQINVMFSLIAQKDSDTSIAIAKRQSSIAEMTARDSRIMRGIGVLTLVFLPSTLVTSVWSTDIVQLDHDKSWKVWLATTVAVTTSVIACWLVFEKISIRRNIQEPYK